MNNKEIAEAFDKYSNKVDGIHEGLKTELSELKELMEKASEEKVVTPEFEEGDIVWAWDNMPDSKSKKVVRVYREFRDNCHYVYSNGQANGISIVYANVELIKKANSKNKLVITMDEDSRDLDIYINPVNLSFMVDQYGSQSDDFYQSLNEDRDDKYFSKIKDRFNLKAGMKIEFDL